MISEASPNMVELLVDGIQDSEARKIAYWFYEKKLREYREGLIDLDGNPLSFKERHANPRSER